MKLQLELAMFMLEHCDEPSKQKAKELCQRVAMLEDKLNGTTLELPNWQELAKESIVIDFGYLESGSDKPTNMVRYLADCLINNLPTVDNDGLVGQTLELILRVTK